VSGEIAVAVVGLGFGANHARVLSELDGVRLAAVCDRDEQRLATVSKSRGAPAFDDCATMLREARPDAVVVAVPAGLHEEVAQAAVAAGCAVLVEKPLAPSLAAGRRSVAGAAAAGVPLMAAHIERFNPALRELARRVRAGEIGRVLQLTARRSAAIRLLPQDIGVVHDSAIHEVDAMRFVLGAEVEHVYAQAQRGVLTPAENAVTALIRFESGTQASLEASWLTPRWTRDLSVLGEDGLFVLDYAAQTLDLYRPPAQRAGPVQGWSRTRPRETEKLTSIAIAPREQLAEELAAFVAAVRDGTAMPVSCEDALAALSVCDALVASARTGRVLKPERWE
jgi:predicted dehydrogenase